MKADQEAEVELLSTEEIELLAAYLREFPPRAAPPPGMPFFDIRRIAATLAHLDASLTNAAARNNNLFARLNYATQSWRGAIVQRDRCMDVLSRVTDILAGIVNYTREDYTKGVLTALRAQLKDFEYWKEHECP